MTAVTAQNDIRSMRISRQLPGDSLRGAFETLIRTRYADAHGADLGQFMPNLLGCIDSTGRPLAVLGYRSAATEALFLEQYLETPIEDALSYHGASAGSIAGLERGRIVEVGNFASCDRHATIELIRLLPGYLIRAGFEWLVFTGTPRVCALVASFGAPLVDLGLADIRKVRGGVDCWGRYYDTAPRVMAGWLGHRAQVAA